MPSISIFCRLKKRRHVLVPMGSLHYARTKKRHFKFIPKVIPPYFNKKKSDPVLELTSIPEGHKTIFPIFSENLWGICRAHHNSSHSVHHGVAGSPKHPRRSLSYYVKSGYMEPLVLSLSSPSLSKSVSVFQ